MRRALLQPQLTPGQLRRPQSPHRAWPRRPIGQCSRQPLLRGARQLHASMQIPSNLLHSRRCSGETPSVSRLKAMRSVTPPWCGAVVLGQTSRDLVDVRGACSGSWRTSVGGSPAATTCANARRAPSRSSVSCSGSRPSDVPFVPQPCAEFLPVARCTPRWPPRPQGPRTTVAPFRSILSRHLPNWPHLRNQLNRARRRMRTGVLKAQG